MRVPLGFALHEDWCCRPHAATLSADRSINSVAWPLALLTLASQDARVLARCGFDKAKGTLADGTHLGLVLAELGPLCCFLDEAQLEESYEAARHADRFKQWQAEVYRRNGS